MYGARPNVWHQNCAINTFFWRVQKITVAKWVMKAGTMSRGLFHLKATQCRRENEHMWAARRPQSFHRGKLTWLTLPLWNTVNSFSVSNVLHCRKSKSSIMSLEFYTTPKEASVTQMLISPIDSGPVLDTSFPCSSAVCCVGLLSLSSHLLCCHTEHCGDATALSNPKTIEESVLVHWFDFTCLMVTDVVSEDFPSPGSSSMVICVSFQLGGWADITAP